MNEQEFIVAYCASFCDIELAVNSVFYYDYDCSLKGQYEDGLKRTHTPGAKYGDVIAWNNRFWCSVKAKNCKDALEKTMIKIEEAQKKWDSQ